MRLNWISTYEQIGENTLQEVMVEEKHKMSMKGRVIQYCQGCKRWVSQHDFEDYCKTGMHEYANEVSLKYKGRSSNNLNLKK